ncbi:MAG: hypothetical protein P1U68_08655 [Verrucomicrobiales bacterium]|nr:hypothetical protein [Verrucomicrobiales bacterium]
MTSLFAFSLLGILVGKAAELDEFCVVQDSDGYTNVREKADLASKVIARVDHGQLVWIYLGGMTKWPEVIFMDKEGEERNGFIHASRLKALTDFEHFTGEVSEEKQTETIERGDLNVEIVIGPFEQEGRTLTYQEYEEGQRYLIEIDDLPYWGTDGGMPRDQYRKITVQKAGKTMTVPDSALKNLYNPGLYPGNTKVTVNPKDDAIYITSFNSDGAGGYVVGFVFENGKFKSRAVLSPF